MKKFIVGIFASALVAVPAFSTAAYADSTTVEGAGSTWSQIAVDQWRADVKSRLGLKINFAGTGSSTGRALYYQGKVDFAVSEIPFQPNELKILNGSNKSYQYLPIVAGGTALMYNIVDVAGRQVKNLQLSPATIAGIFTGTITNWSDAKITADNGGTKLPSKAIVPVVRADGSGTSAQFSAYLASEQGAVWKKFASANGRSGTSGTSDYPNFEGAVAQSGSDGVANYVANRSTGVGAIGYVETGYAIQRGFPVAAVKNASGKYVLPTPANVAKALEKAKLNKDRTQILTGVYRAGADTAYPISSYSYMITATDGLNPAKGAVLSKFMQYFACDGQQKASVLGYAPLPPNLVQVVFDAIQDLPGHDTAIPAKATKANCNNPTFSGSLGKNSNSAGSSTTGGSTSGGGTTGADPSASGGTTTTDDTTTTDGTTSGSGSSGSDTYAAATPTKLIVEPGGTSIPLPALLLLGIVIGPALLLALSRRLFVYGKPALIRFKNFVWAADIAIEGSSEDLDLYEEDESPRGRRRVSRLSR